MPPQQGIRNLEKDPGAVTCFEIPADCTTVEQVFQDPDSLFDNAVAFYAVNIGHKSDSTGIVFITGVIQTLCFRKSAKHIFNKSSHNTVSLSWT
jgi:hypothetical protein